MNQERVGNQTYAAVKIAIDKSPPLPQNNMMLSGHLQTVEGGEGEGRTGTDTKVTLIPFFRILKCLHSRILARSRTLLIVKIKKKCSQKTMLYFFHELTSENMCACDSSISILSKL